MSIQQALVQTRGDVFAAALLVEVMASAYYDNDPDPNMGTDSKDSSRRIQKSAQARKLYIEMYNFYARKLEEFGVKTIEEDVNASEEGFKAWIEEKNVELAQYDDREAMTAKLRELGITNMKEVIEIYCQFNVIKWLAEYQLFLTRLVELKELRPGIMRKTGKLFVRAVQQYWEASEEKQELDEYFEKVKAIEKMAVSANMPGASPRESVGSQDAEMSQADQGPSSNVAGSDDDSDVSERSDEEPEQLSEKVLGYLEQLPLVYKQGVYFRDPAGKSWEYDAKDVYWALRSEESLDSTKETIRLQEESGQTWEFVSEDGSSYWPPFSPSPPQSPAKESRQEPKELSDVELTSLKELPEPGKVYFRAEDRNFWALDPVLDKWVPRPKGSLVLTKEKIYLLLDNVGQPLGFYKVDDDELFYDPYDPLAPKPWEQQGQQERQRQPEKKRLRQWGKEREQQRERDQEEIDRRLGMDRGAIEEEERRRWEREQEEERRQQQQEEGEERRRRGGRKRLRKPDSGRQQPDQGLERDLAQLLDEEERELKQIGKASPSSPGKKKSSSSGTPHVDLTGTDDTGAFRPRDKEARVDAWLQGLPKLVIQGNAVYFKDQNDNFSIKSASEGWSSSKVEPAYAFKIIIDEKGPMFEPLWVNDEKIQRESPGHMLMLEILKAQLRSFKNPVTYGDMGENIKAFVDPVFLDEQRQFDDLDTFSVGEVSRKKNSPFVFFFRA